MPPSPTEVILVEGKDLGNENLHHVNLLPVESIPQEADGLALFPRDNVLPQAGFYIPETASTADERTSHVGFIGRLLNVGAYHRATGQYDSVTLKWGEECRQLLKRVYKTTIGFALPGIKDVQVELGDKTAILESSCQTGDRTAMVRFTRSFHALLALGEKSLGTVLKVAEENGISQFDYKTGRRTKANRCNPSRTYIADYDTRPLTIRPLGENRYQVDEMSYQDALREDKPYFVAISGPQPTFADFVRDLRAE